MDPKNRIERSIGSDYAIEGKRLRGLIPYNRPTQLYERGRAFTEVIRPGAFSRSIARGNDIVSFFNHDRNRLLGRTSSGTLRLTDTPEGLTFEVDLPEHAKDIREMVERGDLTGASFTGFTRKGGEEWTSEARELTDIYMVEIGPVVSPAYRDSTVMLRAEGVYSPSLQLYQYKMKLKNM